MRDLLALDLPLGPALEAALRDCVEHELPFCVLDQRLSPRRREEQLRWLGATRVRSAEGEVALSTGRSVDDEIGAVVLTSGSSGPPKAAELTWSALRASAELTTAALDRGRRANWLPLLPANHIGGLAVVLRAVLGDAALTWSSPDDVATSGATHVAVVRPQLARFDLSSFDVVLLGGAAPPETLAPNVVTTWGMTETGSGVVYDRRALAGVDLAIVDGELCVKSPTLFRSYRGAPRPTKRGPDGLDDWFPTGDGGSLQDGELHVHGRLATVINTGGEKIWPEDLERVLGTVHGVREVAVTGLPDSEWGQRVVALVVTNGERLDDALRAAANEQIGPWAKPKEIRYVAALPRTSNGKIRRSDLATLH